MDNRLQVGFGRVDITPDFPVGLGGYDNANKRIATKVFTNIYMTCVAFRDGNKTILLFTFDNCACSPSLADRLRPFVTEATGIPGIDQFYGATHSHSCPSIFASEQAGGVRYNDLLNKSAARAAVEALADLAPATVFAGNKKIEKMNYVRHYVLKDGTNAELRKHDVSELAGHPAEADNTMVLVKFTRKGKQDILLVNWHSHPDHSGILDPDKNHEENFHSVSADFPGALRSKVETESGVLVAFFTGASGNATPFSRIPEEKTGLSMTQYGEKLGEFALMGMQQLQPVEGSGIETKLDIFEAEVDHTLDDKVEQAKEVYAYYQETDITASRPLARQYGFQSAYQARAVISRSEMEPSVDIPISAFRVGGIGFINSGYEMFSCTGIYIKEHSPYAATMIVSGNSGYIASRYTFEFGSYEAVTGMYREGVAEKLAEHHVNMLKDIQ